MPIETIKLEIGKLNLSPGDILVAKVTTPKDRKTLDHIKRLLSDLRPPGVKVALIDSDLEFSVISLENPSEKDVVYLIEQDKLKNHHDLIHENNQLSLTY